MACGTPDFCVSPDADQRSGPYRLQNSNAEKDSYAISFTRLPKLEHEARLRPRLDRGPASRPAARKADRGRVRQAVRGEGVRRRPAAARAGAVATGAARR